MREPVLRMLHLRAGSDRRALPSSPRALCSQGRTRPESMRQSSRGATSERFLHAGGVRAPMLERHAQQAHVHSRRVRRGARARGSGLRWRRRCYETRAETSAEEWADGVCTALTTWTADLETAAEPLGDVSSLSGDSIRQAADDVKVATETLTESLRSLGRPDTESGEEVQARSTTSRRSSTRARKSSRRPRRTSRASPTSPVR